MRVLLLVAAVAALFVLPASAARFSGSVTLSPSTVQAGGHFGVSGCGFGPYGDTEFGNVVVGFAAGSWGSPLDAEGCFTIGDIPALSGDSLPAGDYEVSVYQRIHPNRLTKVATATLTVVP